MSPSVPSVPPEGPEGPEGRNKITCEFAIPCTTTPLNPTTGLPDPPPRKVISHIFGRNKTATKRFPPHVWVHYCRKHYQRARYRATQWPFIQCELLLDSLRRMEVWGGVRCFAVVLRKREIERLTPGSSSSSTRAVGEDDADADAGHKRTATGKNNSENKARGKGKGTGKGKKGKGKKRKTPRIVAAPVPDWLREELGDDKSFGEIRALLRRVMDDLARQQARGRMDLVRFPDIEILPTFHEWVMEETASQVDGEGEGEGEGEDGDVSEDEGSEGDDEDDGDGQDDESESDVPVTPHRRRRMSRVSKKGGVQKI